MHNIKKIIFCILLMLSFQGKSQQVSSFEEVNVQSYALYEKASWHELLTFGKTAIAANQDFPMLRLRMGYAAFMLTNFSDALIHYEKVLENDSYNSTAHYYIWLCRNYLNQTELATLEIPFLSDEVLVKEKKKGFAITGVSIESSFKNTNITTRGNTFYQFLGIQNRFGNNLYMDQAAVFLNQGFQTTQTIMPGPPGSGNSAKKDSTFKQSEYYNKLSYSLSNRLQLKIAYHYTNTSFGQINYQNQTAFAALRYHANYFDIQAEGIYSTMFDSSISQMSLQIAYYPLGNMNLYGFSTATIRNRPSGSAFNYKQVIGAKITNGLWLEANATFGKFRDLFENDAKYIYNAPDENLFKGGLVSYISLSTKCTLELGYTLEQRAIYSNPSRLFNQHSITGGLSWKF